MDILRKEINAFYQGQHLPDETLDYSLLDDCRSRIDAVVSVERDCRVITDAARDCCYIRGGDFAVLIGLSDSNDYHTVMDSGDEDEIYNRIHPEDLAEKRMLEYEFFKHVDARLDESKLSLRATSHLRIMDRTGRYIHVDNCTRILQLSPKGKVWLILCCYSVSPIQETFDGICPRIIDIRTGAIHRPELAERRTRILTDREKEILNLIREGKLSKQIADILHISIHTVNRHRQNILGKLSVGNSVEAVSAATLMRLL
ncbi:MAG: helix-turn-helix transcriptional regulator [Duncaniella sp.]|nr:helix-turn-helix transcriptional regulator [Duncaniella sp.]